MTIRKVAVAQVHTGERVGDDVQRLGQRAASGLNQMPFSTGVWKRSVSLSYTPTTVAHGLGRVPQGFFVTAAKATQYDEALSKRLWLDRLINGPSLTSLSQVGANFTVGCQFIANTSRECIGLRFAGYNPGVAKTFTLSLWNDTTSALLGSIDVALAAGSTSWKAGFFTKPVMLTAGTTYVAGSHQTTGANYIRTSTVDAMSAAVPISYGSDITLTAMNRFVAGAGKPNAGIGTETYWIEPVLTDRRAVLVEKSATTPADPLNQLSLVASGPAVVDLWIY